MSGWLHLILLSTSCLAHSSSVSADKISLTGQWLTENSVPTVPQPLAEPYSYRSVGWSENTGSPFTEQVWNIDCSQRAPCKAHCVQSRALEQSVLSAVTEVYKKCLKKPHRCRVMEVLNSINNNNMFPTARSLTRRFPPLCTALSRHKYIRLRYINLYRY